MTVFEFQATRIERIAVAFAHFIATTQPDKLDWHVPLEGAETRTAFEMVGECIRTNRYFAALLRGEHHDGGPRGANAPPMEFRDAKDAQTQLTDSARELAEAVRQMAISDLDRNYVHWSGAIKGLVMIEMPYRNMAYHAGQVNFIQTLYGDTEFHLPDNWRK